MKASKIQLMELTLVKSLIHLNPRFDPSPANEGDAEQSFELQSAKWIHPTEKDSNEVDLYENTVQHKIRLGVRTPQKHEHSYPYSFEVVFAGTVLNSDPHDGDPEQLAVQYGLALLYGAVRDHIFALSARMERGPLLVPTMSFMDETYEGLFSTYTRMLERRTAQRGAEATTAEDPQPPLPSPEP